MITTNEVTNFVKALDQNNVSLDGLLISDIVVLVRSRDVTEGQSVLYVACTEGTDSIVQLGMMQAASFELKD